MKLKTYRAPTMADALTAVKNDLGRRAVILHTRAVKTGGVLGFRRKTVVEITASDQAPALDRRLAAKYGGTAPAREPVAIAATAAALAYRRSSSGDAGALARPAAAPIDDRHAETQRRPPIPAPPTTMKPAPEPRLPAAASAPFVLPVKGRRAEAPARPAEPVPASGSDVHRKDSLYDRPFVASLLRELADIKLLVNHVLHSAPASPSAVVGGSMPDALFRHYLRLLEAAVSRDIADAIIAAARDELTPAELSDDSIVRNTVLRHLASLIPVAETVARTGATPDGRPLTIALVGPTGVGKTTTIAKLAAAYRLRHGKTVALVTSDTYRIAAVDQLRTYAGIIGLPVSVVSTPCEMRSALDSLAGYDVVLIDTAGRSQHARTRLDELAAFLAEAVPHETHLVLSSTATEAVLLRTAEAFATARPNRVILTKLDEAVNFGVVVNVARRLSTAVSYVTTGQEVPDHIEPGRPDRLARMVLDNELSMPGVRPPAPVHSLTARSNPGLDTERAELLGARAGE